MFAAQISLRVRLFLLLWQLQNCTQMKTVPRNLNKNTKIKRFIQNATSQPVSPIGTEFCVLHNGTKNRVAFCVSRIWINRPQQTRALHQCELWELLKKSRKYTQHEPYIVYNICGHSAWIIKLSILFYLLQYIYMESCRN